MLAELQLWNTASAERVVRIKPSDKNLPVFPGTVTHEIMNIYAPTDPVEGQNLFIISFIRYLIIHYLISYCIPSTTSPTSALVRSNKLFFTPSGRVRVATVRVTMSGPEMHKSEIFWVEDGNIVLCTPTNRIPESGDVPSSHAVFRVHRVALALGAL